MVFAIDSVVSVVNAETKPCLDIGDYTGTAGEAIKVQDTMVNHFPLLIRTIMTVAQAMLWHQRGVAWLNTLEPTINLKYSQSGCHAELPHYVDIMWCHACWCWSILYILLNIILALGTEIDHYCQEVMQYVQLWIWVFMHWSGQCWIRYWSKEGDIHSEILWCYKHSRSRNRKPKRGGKLIVRSFPNKFPHDTSVHLLYTCTA